MSTPPPAGPALGVPVVLTIYRRPNLTRRILERIREVRPKRLFVVADGPRSAAEEVLCAEARAVVEEIDWPCDCTRIYAAENLGCGRRISTGLDSVFSQVDEAIILEDDCLPDLSFFSYCEELLRDYRANPLVMHVGGTRFEPEEAGDGPSYRFSKYTFIWGWATWRRAWKAYDFRLRRYATGGDRCLARAHPSGWERRYWKDKLDLVRDGRLDTWDYQWNYACWESGGLAVIPARNLVTNIGDGPDGTHEVPAHLLHRGSGSIGAIRHPALVKADTLADKRVFRSFYGGGAPPGLVIRGIRGAARRARRIVSRVLERIGRDRRIPGPR